MVEVGTGAAQMKLNLQIGSAFVLTFKFRSLDTTTGLYSPTDISLKTFSFTLWKNKGDRVKTLNLTNGSGITVPIYSIDEIRVASTISVSVIEGDYYFELRRTDLNQPSVWGVARLDFDGK